MTTEIVPAVLNKHCSSVGSDAVYIGRGSKWGNPFRIGQDGDRAAVIAKHERWLRDQHHLLRDLGELRGNHLVCFCAPAPCHGDLLLRLANGPREDLVAWWRAAPSDEQSAVEPRKGAGAAREIEAPSDQRGLA